MKKTVIAFIAGILAFAGCQKENASPKLDFGYTDYSSATEVGAMALEAEVEFDESYGTTGAALDKNSVLAAFGEKKVPSDITFYGLKADGSRAFGPRAYTSKSGFYFNSEGYVCSASDDDACLFVDFTASSLMFSIGQVPEKCEADSKYVLHGGLATASVLCPLDITVTLVGAGEWAAYTVGADGLTYNVQEKLCTDYSALTVEIDEDAFCKALGINDFDALVNKIGDSITYVGINADGSESAIGNTANNYGCWYDAAGNVCSWKADNWFAFAEWDGTAPLFFNIGQAVEGVELGQKGTIRNKFTNSANGKEVVLTFNLEIVAKISQ